MDDDQKIDTAVPDLLVKYRKVVMRAVQKGVSEALATHKAVGNKVAVSRNGKVVVMPADEIVSEKSSHDAK